MVTPFPGMDPYLEHPALWPGEHTRLLIELSKRLAPQIRPRYVVSVEERIFVEIPEQQKIPDLWPQRARFEIYPLQLRDRLPKLGVPLAEPDADVAVDLQAAFDQVDEDGGSAQRVRYDEPCIPPLPEDDQNWAFQRWAAYRQP